MPFQGVRVIRSVDFNVKGQGIERLVSLFAIKPREISTEMILKRFDITTSCQQRGKYSWDGRDKRPPLDPFRVENINLKLFRHDRYLCEMPPPDISEALYFKNDTKAIFWCLGYFLRWANRWSSLLTKPGYFNSASFFKGFFLVLRSVIGRGIYIVLFSKSRFYIMCHL